MYLKRRLEEAEAEKQYIFEKIKLQENQHATSSSGGGARLGGGAPSAGEPSQAMMLSKIQDLLKNVRSLPSGKPDGQRSK
uniref:Oberon coiled-coil region domain-containing protein n=1 Tax=Zea mays TaxID=4577 RepID=B6U8Z5_MAIZE|nr:hypothetical protein [Zea mays]